MDSVNYKRDTVVVFVLVNYKVSQLVSARGRIGMAG